MTETMTSTHNVTHEDIALALAGGDVSKCYPPTTEQRAVLDAPFAPSLVVAGAGSGKTHTMVLRMLTLVARDGVDPASIIGLTFTRKAAGELQARVSHGLAQLRRAGLIAPEVTDEPEVSTYNSFANNIYRDWGLIIGTEPDVTLLDESSAWMLMHRIVTSSEDIELSKLGKSVASITRSAHELAQQCRDNRVNLDELEAFPEWFAKRLETLERSGRQGVSLPAPMRSAIDNVNALIPLLRLVRSYNEEKRRRGLIEFADQVVGASEIIEASPQVRDELRTRYQHVILDEYQDTSAGQLALLSTLFRDASVMAVGDPKQAIYGWRGASPGTMNRFHDDFSSTPVASARNTFTLSTSWRNDKIILAAANTIARSLPESGALPSGDVLPELGARDGAGPGQLDVVYRDDVISEAQAAAERCEALLAQANEADPPSIAMLFRRRATMDLFAAELKRAGIPHRVLALGGVLSSPEVVDLMCFMRVLNDPAAGNELLRLLAGARYMLGLQDLAALGNLARRIAHLDWQLNPIPESRTPGRVLDSEEDQASLLEALEVVAATPDGHPRLRDFTDEGVRRLREAAALFAELRALGRLPITELVDELITRTGIDLEIESNPRSAAHLRNLDAFVNAIHEATARQEHTSVTAVLDWLEKAAERDEIASEHDDPEPGTVQLLTMHASKGLEWDHVIIPRLVTGEFPGTVQETSGWLLAGKLPYRFRLDARALPDINLDEMTTRTEWNEAKEELKEALIEQHELEERRLAYVAFTRARSSLTITASTWKTSGKPSSWSLYLDELADAEILPEPPELEEELVRPDIPTTGSTAWPRAAMSENARGDLLALRDAVSAAQQQGVEADAGLYRTILELLLAEREERNEQQALSLPERLAASRFKDAIRDPQSVMDQLRRPMPERPYRQTRLGTMLHSWIEEHYGHGGGGGEHLDLDELEIDDDSRELLGVAAERPEDRAALEPLKAQFLASSWANRTPIAIEQSIDVKLGNKTVVCKIDAVFGNEDGTVELVDWKTGKPPRGEDAEWERQLQLALYTLAWSKHHHIPSERIHAKLVYLSTNEEFSFDTVSTETELQALIESAEQQLAEGGESSTGSGA